MIISGITVTISQTWKSRARRVKHESQEWSEPRIMEPRVTTRPIPCPAVLFSDTGAIEGLKLRRCLVNVNFISPPHSLCRRIWWLKESQAFPDVTSVPMSKPQCTCQTYIPEAGDCLPLRKGASKPLTWGVTSSSAYVPMGLVSYSMLCLFNVSDTLFYNLEK